MIRRLALAAALALSLSACTNPATPIPATTFTGTWRAVTPSYEHLRLTVTPNATIKDLLHVRLAFSGVAWEGPGRIEADSLVMDMSTSSMSGTKVVARPGQDGALSVRAQSDAAGAMNLTFVREQ